MPWTCPACRLPISHTETEARPRYGVTYRCHVCRLELVVERSNGRLALAPLGTGDADHGHEVTDISTADEPSTRRTRRPRS